MIDLETLSKRTDAAIVQVAAVAFDSETGETLSTFNRFVFEQHSPGYLDVDTIAWWLIQEGAAKFGKNVLENGVGLSTALHDLCAWFTDQDNRDGVTFRSGVVEGVWAHGATFDFPVLAFALDRCGIAVPWSHRAPRDTRTLYALAPGGCPKVETDPARKHDALYDCEVQVQQVVQALAALRSALTPSVTVTVDVSADVHTELKNLRAEVERWKEEYRVTEAARAAFEAALCAQRPADTERDPLAGAPITDDRTPYVRELHTMQIDSLKNGMAGQHVNDHPDHPPVPGGYRGADRCGDCGGEWVQTGNAPPGPVSYHVCTVES
jgi:hypothetical protein